MAQYAQMSRGPGEYCDVQVYNDSGSDIPAGYAVLFQTVANQPRAVVLPTASGGSARLAGVTTTVVKTKGYGLMCIHGPAVAYAHAALATGDFVQASDTNGHVGEVKPLDTGATQEAVPCLGRCVLAAAADGDACVIYVCVSPATTAA